MGTMYVMVDITNSGTGDCTMRDSDLTGLRWGKDHHPTAPVAALDQAVVIPGGRSQEYRLGFPSSCSTSPDGTATTPTEATIGGQNVSVTSGGIPASLAGCDATEVSAVGASNGSDEAVSPFADLHADMDVAHTVAAGLLSYTITLTNNGTEALNLAARCPSYTQRITFPGSGPVDERYRLNCEAASELAPGASVTFAMQVTIPDTAITAGEIKLLWLMDDDGPDAGELLNAPTSAQ